MESGKQNEGKQRPVSHEQTGIIKRGEEIKFSEVVGMELRSTKLLRTIMGL